MVSALLAAGAETNAGSGTSALYIASQEGHADVVSALLAAGAEADRAGADGRTPLLIASIEGHVAVVAALLAKGARADVVPAGPPEELTPLFAASLQGHVKVMVALLEAGAQVDMAAPDGFAPLLLASQEGHVEAVTALLAAGANVEGVRSDGATPIFSAAMHGNAKVVSVLLAAGAEVDSIFHDEDDEDSTSTPLFMACYEGHADVVALLLLAGASVNWCGNQGQTTPLMATCQQGHREVASVLLAAGAAVNQADHQGRTAMSLGCGNGHFACVQILSSYGAVRTFQSPEGEVTAEQGADFHGHEALTSWLVESRQWSTPLHHLRIIGASRAHDLLRDGANIHAAAAAGGPTPLSLAQALRVAGNPEAAEGSAASLVLAAAELWGPRTHDLFPTAARDFAVELLLIGHQLSRQPRFAGEEIALVDVWTQLVMPNAVVR